MKFELNADKKFCLIAETDAEAVRLLSFYNKAKVQKSVSKSYRKKCKICGKEVKTRGMNLHNYYRHGRGTKPKQTETA